MMKNNVLSDRTIICIKKGFTTVIEIIDLCRKPQSLQIVRIGEGYKLSFYMRLFLWLENFLVLRSPPNFRFSSEFGFNKSSSMVSDSSKCSSISLTKDPTD